MKEITVTPQEYHQVLRPFLDRLEKETGLTITYTIKGKAKPPYNHDIEMIFSSSKRMPAFDSVVEEAVLRFNAYITDWECMKGLPPIDGGWQNRPITR